MKATLMLVALFGLSISDENYTCGEKKMVKKPYGIVEQRVDCELVQGSMWIAEFKGDINHGISLSLDRKTQRKTDSEFYVDGKNEGVSISWHSSGKVKILERFHNGYQVGKKEAWDTSGKLVFFGNYNDSGMKHGPRQELWPNGNKKLVSNYVDGRMITWEAYFPSGVLRYKGTATPKARYNELTTAETFSPKGKPTGKVINGNGELWMFTTEPDSTTKKYRVLHMMYKDSVETENEDASAKKVKELMR